MIAYRHACAFGQRGIRRREDLASTVLQDRERLADDLAQQHEKDGEREDEREEQPQLEQRGTDVTPMAGQGTPHLFACGDRRGRCSGHQYCLLTRRTKRSEMTFRLKVIRNSNIPTKKKL